jgi:2-methylcitrate dehydratase PrpD
MRSPRVVELRQRIHAVGDPTLTDPDRRWRCAMEVTLKDGRVFSHRTLAAKGGVDSPIGREDEEEKALDLMAPVLGSRRSKALIGTLLTLDTLKNARALRRLYSNKQCLDPRRRLRLT